MENILVTGACGQIGSELVARLRELYGKRAVIATDVKRPSQFLKGLDGFMYLDVLNKQAISQIVVEHDIKTIFHMAAILSAVGEKNPQLAFRVNINGLENVLEVAVEQGVKKVIMPSSIAVFGPDAPKENTPNEAPLNPTTMYGVTKVAGEKLLQYYHIKYGLDTRSLRYPGIISSETAPGGGTTDYAVDLYVHAVMGKSYGCYINESTPLPFMYMPDAIKAIVSLAQADGQKLKRQVYNVHALKLTPADIVASIRKYYPEFQVDFRPDFRQKIAESWPHSLDDSPAREEWDWKPDFGLDEMTRDMLEKLKQKTAAT